VTNRVSRYRLAQRFTICLGPSSAPVSAVSGRPLMWSSTALWASVPGVVTSARAWSSVLPSSPVYSRRGARVDYLSREFARTENFANHNRYRSSAEAIIQIDENEIESEYGQRVGKIFHDADFIVSLDSKIKIENQIERFCELIFGSNCISPTQSEYGIFMAKAAALRALDLSRQVGAAIFNQTGEIIALGSNEVPKATGGTYWSGSDYDDRGYVRMFDSNYKRKHEILSEILNIIGQQSVYDDIKNSKKFEESQFMDALNMEECYMPR
jgi:deoxycytidylate deaminase